MNAGPLLRRERWWLAGLVVLLAIPLLPADWQVAGAFPKIFVFAIAGLGLTVLTGWTGMLHLGSAAFMAVGAYTYAIATGPVFPFQIGPWPALALATATGAVAGIVLGMPTVRLRGDYLAIVTLGFGEIVQDLLRNLEPITKGSQGIAGLPKPAADGAWMYYAYLAVLLAVVAAVGGLRRLPIGRAWLAMREDEIAARCTAVGAGPTVLAAVAVAGALGALAGGLWAGLYGSSNEPGTYDFATSTLVLCVIIVGGMGSHRGAILGAVIMAGLSTLVIDRLANLVGPSQGGNVLMQPANWKYLVFGLALVLMMRLRPQGLCAEPRP
jgi:branched-chain amino acid transport system permease protein